PGELEDSVGVLLHLQVLLAHVPIPERDAGLKPGQRDHDAEARAVVLDADLVGFSLEAEPSGAASAERCGGLSGGLRRRGEEGGGGLWGDLRRGGEEGESEQQRDETEPAIHGARLRSRRSPGRAPSGAGPSTPEGPWCPRRARSFRG